MKAIQVLLAIFTFVVVTNATSVWTDTQYRVKGIRTSEQLKKVYFEIVYVSGTKICSTKDDHVLSINLEGTYAKELLSTLIYAHSNGKNITVRNNNSEIDCPIWGAEIDEIVIWNQ